MSSSEDDEDEQEEDGPSCPAWIPSAVSNFTVQFNFASASVAELFMLSHNDDPGVEAVDFDFPQPKWVHSILKSAVFIGSIVGMLVMGRLGDAIGIRKALLVTNTITTLSALASAVFVFGSPDVLWGLFVFWRFILGVGVGGNYPLAAAKASSVGTIDEAVSKAGRSFFWQGPGAVAPYLLGYALCFLPHDNGITNVQFRIILGAGAIPSALVVYFMLKEKDPPQEMGATQSAKKEALVDKHISRRSFQKTLIGTAGAWFWFDVAWYGTNIFAPDIMKEIFPPGAPLTTITLRSAILPCCGILGTLVGIPLLGRIGPQMLNAVGILVAAFLYCLFAWFMKYNPDMKNTMFFILCAVNFSMKGFPEIATYVLPVMSFPRSIRATYHGRSGSAGKIGAMLATFIFPILTDATSLQAVFISQAVACVLCAVMASFLVRPMSSHEEVPSTDGTLVACRDLTQDYIEDNELEEDIYAPEDAKWIAATESIATMRGEIAQLNGVVAQLNRKVDMLLVRPGF